MPPFVVSIAVRDILPLLAVISSVANTWPLSEVTLMSPVSGFVAVEFKALVVIVPVPWSVIFFLAVAVIDDHWSAAFAFLPPLDRSTAVMEPP